MLFTKAALGAVLAQSAAARYNNVLYWGANDSERSLASYCTSSEGVDIIVIGFLDQFGNGNFPSGYVGNCLINSDGSAESECQQVAKDIDTCKANGKKVFISIGGAGARYQLNSAGDAKGVAYSLWNGFANPAHTSNSARPFGNTFVDGWDVDVEDDHGSKAYLGDLINALRAYFPNDPDHTYAISGAPQCVIPDDAMGNSMMQAQYDYLWIQFYNNNCAAGDLTHPGGNPNGDGHFNLADWPGYLSNGASKNAKLYVGIPGDHNAASSFDYIPSNQLPQLVGNAEGVKNFGGVMVYDAEASDNPNVNGCNYAQEVRHVLDTGNPC